MKFTETIERWFSQHPGKSNRNSDSSLDVAEMSPTRVRRICAELGEDIDPEALQMLGERGLDDASIAEIIQAVNMLNCRMVGILDLEINKMYAEGVLSRFGYQDIEQFNDDLLHFHNGEHVQH